MSRDPLRVPLEDLAPGDRALGPEASAYVAQVRRLGPGDRIVLFDPDRAEEADAEIVAVGRRAVTVRVGEARPAALRPARAVTLVQGVGKGDKMDAVVRDATELGVTRVVPAICARSVALPPAARAARWRRIAVEAARQCGRGDAPAIEAPILFEDALRRAAEGAEARLCLDPGAEAGFSQGLDGVAAEAAVAFAVGPEGGLTGDELAAADRAGFVRVTLGPLVLRTETVCAAVLGALLVARAPRA
jgi:16S rRNA (uracil1498-N3)-methyltransferase